MGAGWYRQLSPFWEARVPAAWLVLPVSSPSLDQPRDPSQRHGSSTCPEPFAVHDSEGRGGLPSLSVTLR